MNKIANINDFEERLKQLTRVENGIKDASVTNGRKARSVPMAENMKNESISEPYFEIKGRDITVPSSMKDISVEGDANSETIVFHMNRFIDGEDISRHSCYIKFLTADGKGDRYPVFNVRVEEKDIYFYWMIDNKVTRMSGKVQFAVAFETVKDNKLLYNWQTVPTTFNILGGLKVDGYITDQYPTLLQQWLSQFESDTSIFHDDIIKEIVGNAPTDMNTLGKVSKALDKRVQIEDGKGLSTNDFTTAEKEKLAGIDDNHFKGTFTTKEALETTHPTAKDGDYAYVGISGTDESIYIWDSTDSIWITSGRTSAETPATIKSKYESNANTNVYTDVDKSAVGAIQNKLDKTGGIITGNVSLLTTPILGNHIVNKQYVDDSVANGGGGTGGGGTGETVNGVSPGNVLNIKLQGIGGNMSITFADPEDSAWLGTKVIRKEGSFPQTIDDGVMILDNKESGKYKETPFIDTGLTDGVIYYYHFFPYSAIGAVNTDVSNRASRAMDSWHIYGVQIDLNNSNPETCVTYTNDSLDLISRSDEWDNIFGIKPCTFENNEVKTFLNPMNYAESINGIPVDITKDSNIDVMIQFPRMGLKITKTSNKIIQIQMTDNPNNPDFKYYAHKSGEVDKDFFYAGAYLSTYTNRVVSQSGINVSYQSYNINQIREMIRRKGINWSIFAFYQLLYIQCMFILKYKTLNSKDIYGGGLATCKTGIHNTNGLNSSGLTSTYPCKVFGIEALFSTENARLIIDGIGTTSGQESYFMTSADPVNFNNKLSGYIKSDASFTNNTNSAYFSNSIGNTEFGFLPIEFNGSQSTYFCEKISVYKGKVVGDSGKTDGGLLGLDMDIMSTDNTGMYYRIMYL